MLYKGLWVVDPFYLSDVEGGLTDTAAPVSTKSVCLIYKSMLGGVEACH